MLSKIRNIGILSHVDAGKTTITEQMLFFSGALKIPGDVNKGTTVSDHLEIEKQRGVSVRSTDVSFFWNNHKINLIDTPGHADFSAEVERSLRIMDAAILVVSAVEGLQPHTFALWDALQLRQIPCIIFINKIDRQGADFRKVVNELENDFRIKTFSLFCPENEAGTEASILSISQQNVKLQDAECFDHALENLAGLDEEILQMYLDGVKIPYEILISKIKDFAAKGQIFPLLTGVAKNGIGIRELLDMVVELLPEQEKSTEKLSALVYKIAHHPSLGKLGYVRVFDGEIKVRDNVFNLTSKSEGKVSQIRKNHLSKLTEQSIVPCGDTGIIAGLPDINTGDVLGSNHKIPPAIQLDVPMMTVEIHPVNGHEFNALASALELLNTEDPRLSFRWYREENELHLNLMGEIQMEILDTVLQQRFNVEAKFGTPTVIYKETPSKGETGFAEYTMPKPCWAVVLFAIEPGAHGSGVVYKSAVSVDKIKQKYQNEIAAAVPKALEQGIKGWEVTDVKITMIGGEDHEIHSRPGDFNIAVPMALMNGLMKTGATLLEPMLNFTLHASEDLLGKITGEILLMRGSFDTPVFDDRLFTLKGKVPAATTMNYGIKLSSISGGKARIRFSFAGYAPCSDQQGVVRQFKGVNPLDRSRWILHSRGALKADDRK